MSVSIMNVGPQFGTLIPYPAKPVENIYPSICNHLKKVILIVERPCPLHFKAKHGVNDVNESIPLIISHPIQTETVSFMPTPTL
jgi:hypothetical protein